MLKGRGCQKFCDKIETLLNSYANVYEYHKFNINDKISTENLGVDTDDE
jgi:hypothetical protein